MHIFPRGIILLFIVFLSTFAFSCRKTPGQGGNSTIRGKVKAIYYDVFGNAYPYYAGKIDVYIIYGDEAYFGDDVETSYDGTYEFRYLRKGQYTLFAYSDCDTCLGKKRVEFLRTEITKNNSLVELEDLVIVKK